MARGSRQGLTPLGIAALALLTERDMHPYEMFTTLVARHEDEIVKLRAGSLYHTVNRLAEEGAVAEVGTERDGNRPERTTYTITDSGRERLQATVAELLAQPVQEYPSFPIAIAEAIQLDRNLVIELLSARAQRVAAKAAELRTAQTHALTKTAEAVLLDIDYLATMAEAEVAWLHRLLARLNDNTLDWEIQK